MAFRAHLLLTTFILATAVRTTAADPLRPPPVLRDASRAPRVVEVTLVAEPARLALMPGMATGVFAYNGTIPGPTIEAREGDRLIVHFKNRLSEPTSVHWHGIHLPVAMDGGPLDPVPAGGAFDYDFVLPPGTAGTYWYHPHPHHRTGFQVAQGLFGALIVRAPDDPLAHLPEHLLILSDSRLDHHGAIDHRHGRVEEANGQEGDLLLVNGRPAPTLSIRPGETQRWRLVNASAARFYRLTLPGHALLHVGSDGGLFEKPVERSEILLTPSERVEVLVRGTGAPGSRSVLQSLPYDRYTPQTRPADWDRTRELMTLQYSRNSPVRAPDIPTTLRHVPPLDASRSTATRLMVLFQGFINGRLFDMNRVDITAPLGAIEIWELENPLAMDHPFHLHGFQFQVLDRNGVPEPFRAWKDTVNVPKGESVRFVVQYTDYPGKWMYHCHILEHEDHGMMGILEVR